MKLVERDMSDRKVSPRHGSGQGSGFYVQELKRGAGLLPQGTGPDSGACRVPILDREGRIDDGCHDDPTRRLRPGRQTRSLGTVSADMVQRFRRMLSSMRKMPYLPTRRRWDRRRQQSVQAIHTSRGMPAFSLCPLESLCMEFEALEGVRKGGQPFNDSFTAAVMRISTISRRAPHILAPAPSRQSGGCSSHVSFQGRGLDLGDGDEVQASYRPIGQILDLATRPKPS